jgi:hypothetical protein
MRIVAAIVAELASKIATPSVDLKVFGDAVR